MKEPRPERAGDSDDRFNLAESLFPLKLIQHPASNIVRRRRSRRDLVTLTFPLASTDSIATQIPGQKFP